MHSFIEAPTFYEQISFLNSNQSKKMNNYKKNSQKFVIKTNEQKWFHCKNRQTEAKAL